MYIKMFFHRPTVALALTSFATLVLSSAGVAGEIDFNRDIRPVLSDKCYHCHGPDAVNQDSEFRLDTLEHAVQDLGGYAGVVPGDADESELIARIESEDADLVMPPPDAPRLLNDREKKVLRQWIESGAEFDQHWAFKLPERHGTPEDRNPIDYFVRLGLDGTGLQPSRRASKRQLLRRATLDLTGLPPTPQEVRAFLKDESEEAYERVIDRLLASPAYGERMAQVWLDASRYADSAGYQNDFKRSQWPWRDWVIDAYNQNLPFDEFSIQQLAGDLLPDADDQMRLATAFSRNHRINNEGGIIPEEFLVEYVADRVETTSTVWLGLTVGCARCHDHKYDPITMRDFYSMFAFFNNVPEKGKDGNIAPLPNMDIYTGGSKEEHDKLKIELASLQREKNAYAKTHREAFERWKADESQRLSSRAKIPRARGHYPFDFAVGKTLPNLSQPGDEAQIRGRENHVRADQPGKHGSALSFRDAGHVKLGRPFGAGGYEASTPISWSFYVKPLDGAIGDVLSCLTTDKRKRGYRVSLVETNEDDGLEDDGLEDGGLAVSFRLVSNRRQKQELEVRTKAVMKRGDESFTHVSVTYDGTLAAEGVKIYIDGRSAETEVVSDALPASFAIQDDHLLGAGLSFAVVDELYVHRNVLSADAVASLAELGSAEVILCVKKPRPAEESFLERTYFDGRDPGYQSLLARLNRNEKVLASFEKSKITKVSIMEEMPTPRETYRLVRGVYDQPDKSEPLLPRTFAGLPPMAEGLPANRLGLAMWLFQDDNPLTARVAVNRYWQMLFGTGLVKTPEDFGSQGSVPTHPELLDWLAVEFRENGWDVKAIIKRIVTSETYRQDSRVTEVALEIDPTNERLSRGPRFRLSAFSLRDQALAASGLLIRQSGGPPVMPYQPAGLWEEVSAKGFKYVVAKDEGLYRRSLYTFWRRTVPPPNMMNFDSAGREMCSVNLSRTNTPLQAMNLLNDPQFVEAARALGQRMMRETKPDSKSRIQRGYGLLLGRPPSNSELRVLLAGYEDYLAAFRKDSAAAKAFISVGHSTPDPELDVIELATCTAVASILLNLDEAVTKE